VKLLRTIFDKLEPHFSKGGKLEKIGPLFDAIDTFAFSPGFVTKGAPHVRDAVDLKRLLITVAFALIPCCLFACYNTGYQANLGLETSGIEPAGWRIALMGMIGVGVDSHNLIANFLHGLLYFLPVYIVTLMAGAVWEVLFACVRRHGIYEGFLITSLLFPLIVPPDIPLWQVALGISFGVLIGKEIFGGVGMNVLNPALVGRVFLYFAYPAEISGDSVWVAVDGYTQATPLGALANNVADYGVSTMDAFIGLMPGSMGETSTLACLMGAVILLATKVGSWRIMTGCLVGMIATATTLNLIGSESNLLFGVTPLEHFVLGGFAFGMVFMATDPVSAAHTRQGQLWYGGLIGFLTVLVRVINPAFPEGIMLAILFANVFAPAIDKIYVNKNIKRRQLRNVAG
jgi:Na+-transporting NADH:ubiquinone oxidoreductase subunit B